MRLGLGLGVNRGRKAGGGNDPVIDALLEQATTDGYTAFSGDNLVAANIMVTSLKNNGVWDKLDYFAVFATNGDSDFSLYNWIDPTTYATTAVNSPSFTTQEGWTGNGTSAYINVVVPTTPVNYTINDNSWGYYTRSDRSGVDAINMIYKASAYTSIGVASDGDFYWEPQNPSPKDNNAIPVSTNGMFSISRTSSSQAYGYVNGVQKDSISIAPIGLYKNLRFLRRLEVYSPYQISMGFQGASLTDTEMGNLYSAFQTYMTSIGKEV